MTRLCIAESAGFCGGVARAVRMVEETLADGKSCWSLGQLIHSDDEVQRLEKLGLKTAETLEEIPEGATVVIRSHGTTRAVLEQLAAKNAEILDATCPNVKRIHDVVFQAGRKGDLVLVIGEAQHPEVQGICGWCDHSAVVGNMAELEKWCASRPKNDAQSVTVVFQTTQTHELQRKSEIFLKKEYTNAEIFDTICGATSIRQKEAAALAEKCDAMVVIGGGHSANSRHLADICREHCGNVQFVSCAAELDTDALKGLDTVGITAGASVPAWIIKEVKQKMCDEIKINEQETEKSFDELLEESIKTIYNGETVSGVVVGITATEVQLDLGTKHSGYIPTLEFTEDTDAKIEDLIHVGDTIEACVVRVNDVEGTVMLSKKRLDAAKNWTDIESACENKTVVEGTVTEENKGGVVVNVRGVRVFVPASQTGLGRDVPMTELVGQKVQLRITEVNGRRRIVGSIREVARELRRAQSEKIWNEIEVGKRYTGTVKSLTSYGAFVDIGGIDGMVHVSELSWSRINKPADVVAVGDTLEVYVIGFDKEKKRISLGYKDPNANPWTMFKNAHNVGDVVSVTIVKLMPFGAFAEVMPGVDGLIHISQIANRRIGKPEDELSVGQVVDAKITNVDDEKQKISLSIRALSEPEKVEAPVEEQAEAVPEDDALVYEVSANGEATGVAPTEAE